MMHQPIYFLDKGHGAAEILFPQIVQGSEKADQGSRLCGFFEQISLEIVQLCRTERLQF